MGIREKISFRNHSFFLHTLGYMLLLVIIITGYLTVSMYLSTKETMEKESLRLQEQTESNIKDTITLSDESYNLFDESLNGQMKQKMEYFLQEYNRSGGDPNRLDLSEIRSQMGDSYELYIINSSGVIEYTTFTPELGQDFSKIPYFYDYLTKIRLEGGFHPDRVVRDELGQGEYRKFAYMATPDHAYILEVGYSSNLIAMSRVDLGARGIIINMTSRNPYIEEIHVFDSMGLVMEEPGYAPPTDIQIQVNEVLSNRSDWEFADPSSSEIRRYLFLDRENPRYGSDLSRVVEITYTTKPIQTALDRLLLFYLIVGIMAIFLGLGIAIILSRHLSDPIRSMVNDVDQISKGDLERKVESPHIWEFRILEQSINTMVASIQQSFAATRESEEFFRTLLDQLPVAVFVKKAPEGTYLFWNQSCEQLLGISAKDAVGKTDREIPALETIDILRLQDTFTDENRIEIRDQIITSKTLGRRFVHTIFAPVKNSKGEIQFNIGIIEDITEENLNRKLNLLSSISRHDILNHLTTILATVELAEARKEYDPTHHSDCKRISESIEAVRKEVAFMGMIQGLGVNAPYWQPVKESFISMISLLPRKDIHITADLQEIEIHADALLPKVFYNLMENSEKHGGSNISTIRLSSHTSGGTLEILYEDNGSGIPADEKEKIFQFGYGKGTGLGLFLIREILNSTGISIREEGVPGNGVLFIIEIPAGSWRQKE